MIVSRLQAHQIRDGGEVAHDSALARTHEVADLELLDAYVLVPLEIRSLAG